jgi:hypothetical protein
VYGSKAHRGFESLSLRQLKKNNGYIRLPSEKPRKGKCERSATASLLPAPGSEALNQSLKLPSSTTLIASVRIGAMSVLKRRCGYAVSRRHGVTAASEDLLEEDALRERLVVAECVPGFLRIS